MDTSEQEAPVEAKKHSKKYDVERVVGEKGRTKRAKQFRIMWTDSEETSWEPLANLSCKERIKEWAALGPEEQRRIQGMSDTELQEKWKDREVTVEGTVPRVVGMVQRKAKQPAERTELTEAIDSTKEVVDPTEGKTVTEIREGVKQSEGIDMGQEDTDVHLVMDLMPERGQKGTLIQRICKMAGIDIKRVVAVMASPPCETFSLADASNISRGNFYRNHQDPDKPPRSLESCSSPADREKRKKALDHDRMVKDLISSVIQDREEGVKYEILIENPVGSMRQRPYMRGEAWEGLTVRRTINYCAYGKPYCKHTDFWSTLQTWLPRGNTHNALCNDGQCGQGIRNMRTGRFNHSEVIAGPRDKKVNSPHYKKTVWEIPESLTTEYVAALKLENHMQDGGIILDLFSGGESWRKASEQGGFKYIPVDIKKFIWTDTGETDKERTEEGEAIRRIACHEKGNHI